MVTERDIPAKQWTSTPSCRSRAPSAKTKTIKELNIDKTGSTKSMSSKGKKRRKTTGIHHIRSGAIQQVLFLLAKKARSVSVRRRMETNGDDGAG